MWKQKCLDESTEKEFYHKNALDTKKKNKLLKIAVGRLQAEYDTLKQKNDIAETDLKYQVSLHGKIAEVTQPILNSTQLAIHEPEEDGGATFMTKV